MLFLEKIGKEGAKQKNKNKKMNITIEFYLFEII